jgi:endoglucanase
LGTVLCVGVSSAKASELRDFSPITNQVLMLDFVDGKAHHGKLLGGGNDGQVFLTPLDLSRATSPTTYQVTVAGKPVAVTAVGRKSKGQDFVNTKEGTKWVPIHSLFLVLGTRIERGSRVEIDLGGLATNKRSVGFTFDDRKIRSETIHVNQIGYVPSAPQKFGYLSQWMGDLGPLSLDDVEGRPFSLVDTKTGKPEFRGRVTLRKRKAEADSGVADEAPLGNNARADIYQADFSRFRRPGKYVLTVEGMGCSYPFRIDADVYREAFVPVTRMLYHQRCGIPLTQKHTAWPRPLCHHPSIRPILQTSHRHLDKAYGDGSAHSGVDEAQKVLTGEKRDVWGGWHDAGDWDREDWHPEVSFNLLLVYELAPKNFRDGDLNIPESGNGIPDIVDEAKWGVDYYKRIQRADGGISCGLFETLWPRPGETSWTDSMNWYMYAEDPKMSYRYASIASRLAWCLQMAGKPRLAPEYIASARKAYTWAEKNTRPGDEAKVRDDRVNAAAALFRATGEAAYQEAFKKDLQVTTPTTWLSVWAKYDQKWGAWTYVTTQRPRMDSELKERLRQATLNYAKDLCLDTAAKRGARYGFDWNIGTGWGAATLPRTMPLIVAHALTKDPKYLAVQYTTCDYMLGGNPMNMVWATGLGKRSPREVFNIDNWYRPDGVMAPGIVPFGPHKPVEKLSGAWDPSFAQHVMYPDVRQWPLHEIWSDIRYTPVTNEYTVGSNSEAAAAYGYLCSPRR